MREWVNGLNVPFYRFDICENNLRFGLFTGSNFKLSGPKKKHRALYQFDARNPDELSMMPGDTVMVRFHHYLSSLIAAGYCFGIIHPSFGKSHDLKSVF